MAESKSFDRLDAATAGALAPTQTETTSAEGAGAVSRTRKGPRPQKIVGLAATHVIMIITSLVMVFPVLWVISGSLTPESDIFTSSNLIPAHPTFINYAQALTDANHPFFIWLGNSLVVALLTTIVGVAISMPAAYALSRFEFLGKQGVLLSFLITQMFPGALLLVPLFRLFSEFRLLGNPYALVLAYATTALPFSVYMMKNFFDAVPRELDQAGLVDGLNVFGVFWRIIAPLTLPGIAVVGFFNFMNSWNEFMLARAFLTDNNSLTLPVGLQSYVFQTGAQWGHLMATAVLITIPVFVMFVWAQRYLITGLTGGSVKG